MPLNLIAAAIWSVLVADGRYVFGHAIEAVMSDLRAWKEGLGGAVLLAGLALLIFWWLRSRTSQGNRPDRQRLPMRAGGGDHEQQAHET